MASGGGAKVVIQAIGGNTFITIIKFLGWISSGSPSLLAEAIHSLADTSNQILLFIGLKQSSKKKSRDYSTGHGNARYLWNLISAVGIFFLGFGVTFYHGMHSLLGDHEALSFSWLAVIILVVSFIIEFWVLVQAYKEVNIARGNRTFLQYFHEGDDPTIVAILLEDGVAVLGVSLALIGVILTQVFDSGLFDSIASLLIAFLLGGMAILLGVVNSKLLLGRSITAVEEEEIKKFIENQSTVESVHQLSTKILGAGQVRLSVEVELHAENLVDQDVLREDLQKLEQGIAPEKIMLKSGARMIRVTGRHINQLEALIQKEFPLVSIIDFEVA